MNAWIAYIGAWALFLLTHAVPVRPPVKPWLIARLGPAGYGIAYSALSLGVLGWLFIAAARAPYVALWPMPAAAHWIALAAMLPAVLLLALTLGRPNPFSFGGARNDQFDAQRPELIGRIRHPVLAALGLWAAAHLAINGTLAHALMFGGFAGFAVLGMWLIDRRKQREMGAAVWQDLRRRSLNARATLPPNAGLRLGAGAIVTGALIAGHQWLSGVAIWPRFVP
ncbi:NnrU family protein [Roseinatronobacter sp.]|uniref:NnrU family protein n=1 Tax=Roseinatronobacter sp. TaxID=1945755 RepID=UPI003F70F4FD